MEISHMLAFSTSSTFPQVLNLFIATGSVSFSVSNTRLTALIPFTLKMRKAVMKSRRCLTVRKKRYKTSRKSLSDMRGSTNHLRVSTKTQGTRRKWSTEGSLYPGHTPAVSKILINNKRNEIKIHFVLLPFRKGISCFSFSFSLFSLPLQSTSQQAFYLWSLHLLDGSFAPSFCFWVNCTLLDFIQLSCCHDHFHCSKCTKGCTYITCMKLASSIRERLFYCLNTVNYPGW